MEEVLRTIERPMGVVVVRYGRRAYTRHFEGCMYIVVIAERVEEDLIVVTVLRVDRRRVLRYGFFGV